MNKQNTFASRQGDDTIAEFASEQIQRERNAKMNKRLSRMQRRAMFRLTPAQREAYAKDLLKRGWATQFPVDKPSKPGFWARVGRWFRNFWTKKR